MRAALRFSLPLSAALPFTREVTALAFKDSLNQFKSKYLAASETIEQRLETARNEIAAVEQDLREKSIDALLAGDDAALAALQVRLRDARERVELLENAATENERVERIRLAKAQTAAERARRNALKQHVSALSTAALEFERAAAAMASSWGDMLSTSRKILAASNANTERDFQNLLSPKMLKDKAVLELSRVGARNPGEAGPGTPDLSMPGSAWQGHGSLLRWQQNPRQAAPLHENLCGPVLQVLSDKEPA